MQINHGVYKGVKIKWDSITLPLKEGTPINIGGNIANNGTAIGLVPQNYFVRPLTSDEIDILVGGDVELAEVEKSSGLTLTTEAKSNVSAIKFHLPDGSVDDSADSSYTLPKATDSKLGGIKVGSGLSIDSSGVLSASGGGAFVIGMTSESDVDTFDKTWKEIHDAMASGQIAVILSEEDSDTVFQNFIAYVAKIGHGDKPYQVVWVSGGNEYVFYATTENDYPSSDDGSGG